MPDSVADELVEASRRVLEARLAPPRGIEAASHAQRWSEVRPHLERVGWFEILEAGAGHDELSPTLATRLLQLAGSYLVPGPVIESVLAVPWLRQGAGAAALSGVGQSVAVVDAGVDLPRHDGRAAVHLARGRVTGSVRCVLDAGSAETFLVHANDAGAETLVVVPADAPGVRVQTFRAADPCQAVGDVEFDCDVRDDQVVRGPGLPAKVRAWTRLGSAAYLAGISERVLAFGVDHALNREQFGRPIGSFQAVQHLLAGVAVTAQSLSNLVASAALDLTEADDAEAIMIGAATKARAGTEAVLACEVVLQVLGGIGFTAEHPLHHYLKRALSLNAQHGAASELNLIVGRLVLTGNQRRVDDDPGELRATPTHPVAVAG